MLQSEQSKSFINFSKCFGALDFLAINLLVRNDCRIYDRFFSDNVIDEFSSVIGESVLILMKREQESVVT